MRLGLNNLVLFNMASICFFHFSDTVLQIKVPITSLVLVTSLSNLIKGLKKGHRKAFFAKGNLTAVNKNFLLCFVIKIVSILCGYSWSP